MTQEAIQKDKQERVTNCTTELNALLKKYDLNLIAKDSWTPNTQVIVNISFVDTKVYPDAEVAQPVAPVVSEPVVSPMQPDAEGKIV